MVYSGGWGVDLVRREWNPSIRMPEMDGCTLLTNLRSKFPGLPVLAVSGYMGEDDLESYGFDGFIDKPIETHRLQDAVEAALAKTN